MVVVITPITKTFEYFSNFEEYPKRYNKYCSKLDIIEKKDNVIITKEIWNVTTPSHDFDHLTIKVRYTIIPPKEIQYEVIDGFGTGIIKGKITFTERENNCTQVEEHYIPLEILAHFLRNGNDPLIMHMDDYFTLQNMKLLEGKAVPYQAGDTCPHCHNGHLTYFPQKEQTQEGNKFYETERFLCDKCGKIALTHKIHANETVLHG